MAKKKEPMAPEAAQRIIINAAKRLARERGISFVDAFYSLRHERPELIEGYQVVINRSKRGA